MSLPAELDVICPRSGVPCPYLFKRFQSIQASEAEIEQYQTQYLVNATNNAITTSMYDGFIEDGRIDLARDEEFNLVRDIGASWEAHRESLVNVVDLIELLVKIEKKEMELAKKSCLIGPRIMHRYVFVGDKAMQCTSLQSFLTFE